MSQNELEVRAVFATAAADALKAFVAAGSKNVLAEYASPLLAAVAQETLKSVAGALALPLLKAILGVSDKLSGRLDKLAREPFETGVRAARDALALTGATPHEIEYREKRLHFAMDNLERAWTLAEGARSAADDRFLIRLMQGSCAQEVRGGRADARAKFDECIETLKPKVQTLERQIARCLDEAKSHRASARESRQLHTGGYRRGRDLDGLSTEPSPLAVAYSHDQKAEALEAQARELARERDEKRAMIDLLREI